MVWKAAFISAFNSSISISLVSNFVVIMAIFVAILFMSILSRCSFVSLVVPERGGTIVKSQGVDV